MDLTLKTEGNKTFLVSGKERRELSRDLLVELYQLLISNLASNRDYSNVSSLTKLRRILELEMEPDESEDETPPKKRTNSKTPVKEESEDEDSDDDSEDEKPVPVKRGRGRPRKPIIKESSDEEDDSE